MKVTATIIALNEERNIARAIESLRCCDEIMVLDSGSTDRTVELAEKLGARVIESVWEGYANQKNRAAEMAGNDWILSLDADEALSESLEGDIWFVKKNGPAFERGPGPAGSSRRAERRRADPLGSGEGLHAEAVHPPQETSTGRSSATSSKTRC